MKRKIKIDIVSDVVCPWCYIGKRRLEKAVDQLKQTYDIELEYHPFELNPGMPLSGRNQREYFTEKFGSEDRYEQLTAQVTQVGLAEGITFNFDKQKVSPNTRKAHSLIQFARAEGLQLPMVEAFFKAYFEDGIDLSDENNLVMLAEKTGLPKDRVQQILADDHALVQVALEEQEMYKLGISGVPFYIINNRYGISGAQLPETFVKALKEISHEPVVSSGEACDIDGTNC